MRSVSYVRCSTHQRTIQMLLDECDPITALAHTQLVHGPGSHLCGVFALHPELLAKTLRIGVPKSKRIVTSLVNLGLIEYDEANNLVYVIGEWLRQQGKDGAGQVKSPTQIASVETYAADLTHSPVARQFIADYELDVPHGHARPAKIPGRGWPKKGIDHTLSDTVPDTLPDTVYSTSDTLSDTLPDTLHPLTSSSPSPLYAAQEPPSSLMEEES